jgi:RNAse (barnase) inhibitor barstar
MTTIEINGSKITDWNTFHELFKEVLGFPEFYGNNSSAWIDCMGDIHNDTKMSDVFLPEQEALVLKINDTKSIENSNPDILEGLYAMTAFVNKENLLNKGQAPIYVLFA